MSSARAAWIYYDAYAINTANATDPLVPWIGTSDTASPWRERINSGPGVPAAPAGNGTAYTGRMGISQGGVDDPPLLTTLTGLAPNTEYNVRVYGVYPNNATSRHFAQFSTDGGATSQIIDNRYDNLSGPPIVWVDASDGGVGAELGARGTSDTRYYTPLTQTLTTDGSGSGSILLTLVLTNPDFAGNQDRFNIDGYAVQVVPEPSVLPALGLGGLALVKRRRN